MNIYNDLLKNYTKSQKRQKVNIEETKLNKLNKYKYDPMKYKYC